MKPCPAHSYDCLVCPHIQQLLLREVAERAAKQGRLGENQVIAILGQDENGDTVQVGAETVGQH